MTNYQYLTRESELYRFLDENEKATWIAYDTEFISEGRYQAELCLVQVATEFGVYVLDPLRIENLNPFWERLCREDTTSIAHACRSELEFCFRALKRFPAHIFDVQLAAAFVGMGYPLGFKMLVQESIGVELSKLETLTDWKRRPLLQAQLRYAINDVLYLRQIADFFQKRLEETNRLEWFRAETEEFCDELRVSFTEERWRKIGGSKRYSADELAIMRELWRWRRDKALERNTAPSRILRDDVILNLVKQRSSDPENIAVQRGINALPESKLVRELSEAIARALAIPEAEKPRTVSTHYPTYQLATQLVGVLLNQYCNRRGMSNQIVATAADIRQAIAHYDGTLPSHEKPKLWNGWRAEFLGDFLAGILSGKYAMQLSTEELDEHPLRLIEANGAQSAALESPDE